MDIKSLPQDVRTKLRSGANISSILQCVTELVLNSLDAKSKAIAIRINFLAFRIQVVDNGNGVTKSNMNLIGIRYMTSKCQSLADLKRIKRFGFRGEALASIRKISKQVNITSRPDNVESTYSKTYKNGKWNPVELVKQRPSKGTTVTIEGFMHNLPVRQKRIDQNLDINEIKRMLESLVIIHPNVSFCLRNDATGKIVFQSNKTKTVSEALSNLYPEISIEDLLEIKISKNKICVSGLISKKRSNNSKLQFIYLNKRPIIAPKIQKLVNSLLLKSLIYRKPPEDFFNFSNSIIEKTEHPVYVLNVKCPYSEVDLTMSPSKKMVEFKNWDVILKCVEKAVIKLLEHENLININSSDKEIDQTKAPSFKSQFGISQIRGAVKSVPAKRKIVENVAELAAKKYQKGLSDVYNNCSGESISIAKDNINDDTKSEQYALNVGDFDKILTLAEVHKEPKMDQKRKSSAINKIRKNTKKKQNILPITDHANDASALDKPTKNNNKETCFKILPTITKYYKNKNLEGRPSWFGKTETNLRKSIDTDLNEEKSPNLDDNNIKIKDKNISPINIFSKHKNTQSLVLYSEENVTKANVHSLLNSTINTNVLENQDKGKAMIMDIFLKSTLVFPNEEHNVTEIPPVKSVAVEDPKKNLPTDRKNQNTTMMTMSWKVMSKKTIVTNSVHPICDLEKNISKDDEQNINTWFEEIQNTRPKENQCKEKMVSKCIQTTMIEHQKELKIDFKCTQAGPQTNSKYTFCESIPQTKHNITFSKYFTKSSRKEQNKPEEYYCFPESNYFNLHQNFEEPKKFGKENTNFDFNLKEDHCRKYVKPIFNFDHNRYPKDVHLPQFNFNDCLREPLPFYSNGVREDFPTYSKNHEHCLISNNHCDHKMFLKPNKNGKHFWKPIKNYFPDYNFDFSNLNVYDEPYRQFMEPRHNSERALHNFPFEIKANPLENYNKNWTPDLTTNVTVPLYQCYNSNKYGLEQCSNYQPYFIQNSNLNNWNEDLKRPSRNKFENLSHPKKFNYENNNALKELYKSIYRDYKQEIYHTRKINEQVREERNSMFKVPKLGKRNLLPAFQTNVCPPSLNNQPKIPKHTFHHGPFNQLKTNVGEDVMQKCYSPFFPKPAKIYAETSKKATGQNQTNREYDIMKKNRQIRRKSENNGFSCVSPFFRKVAKDVPISKPRQAQLIHKNLFSPIEKTLTNYLNMEPRNVSRFAEIDSQLDFTSATPSPEEFFAPRQQYTNNDDFLIRKPGVQTFFLPKQSNLFKRSDLLEQKENQVKMKPEKKRNQEYANFYAEQPNNAMTFDDQLEFTVVVPSPPRQRYSNEESLLFKKPMVKKFFLPKQINVFEQKNNQTGKNLERIENQEYANFFTEKRMNKKRPPSDFLFSRPQVAPKNFQQEFKPSMRKFNTDPLHLNPSPFFKTPANEQLSIPETNFNFKPAFKKFCTEPLRTNFYQNTEEVVPTIHKLNHNSSLESNQFFIDLTTPQHDKEMEYSFITPPNINSSKTINHTIQQITLDDSEYLSNFDETEDQNNLTICSKNFKPALSSTRLEEELLLNTIPKINQHETEFKENVDLSFDIVEETLTKNFNNFLVPSFNLIKNHHENTKKNCSLLNISIDTIKKSQLILKEMSDDCKLNRKSESCEIEEINNNFINSEICNMINQNENKVLQTAAEDEWIETVNTYGKLFYIHKRTGMTSMLKPQQDTHFNYAKRIDFVPKGLSPIFIETKKIDASLSPTSKKSLHATILKNYENELHTIKWSNYIDDYNNANAFFEELYREKNKRFGAQIPDTTVNELPKSMVKLCNKTQAQSFTKDIFTELIIIGQLDNKFIVAMLKTQKLIILFDQHAVHERVRLEQLTNDYKEPTNNIDVIKFKSSKYYENIIITLTPSDLNILDSFKNLFENIGLQYTIIFGNSIEITHIPTCIYNKFVGNKEKNKEIFLENISSLIQEQIAMVTSTRGVSSKIPNALQNVINLEACRGAVKFGDKLTINECEQYIKELSICQLPFQCAHGRPTLVPIVSVKQNFQTIKTKPNLKKLKHK